MDRLAKIIRICSIAPFMACVMLSTLFFRNSDIFGSTLNFLLAILFLTILPVLAYPLQPIIPHFKNRGRDGQRELAMVFAVCGYIMGCVICFISNSTTSLWIIYLEYLFSGLCILICNKLFHLKASGHACGVVGPICLLCYFRVPVLITGLLITLMVYWASLKMGRHTFPQLLGGSLIPIAVILFLQIVLP